MGDGATRIIPLDIILIGKHFTSLIAWQQGWDSQERNKLVKPMPDWRIAF